MNPTDIEILVVITSIQPLLLAWVASICFFVTLAITAMLSPGRRWFELVVIFGLTFLMTMLVGIVFIQGILGVQILRFEAAEMLRIDHRMLPPL